MYFVTALGTKLRQRPRTQIPQYILSTVYCHLGFSPLGSCVRVFPKSLTGKIRLILDVGVIIPWVGVQDWVSDLSTSTHLSLLLDCGWKVTRCLLFTLPRFPQNDGTFLHKLWVKITILQVTFVRYFVPATSTATHISITLIFVKWDNQSYIFTVEPGTPQMFMKCWYLHQHNTTSWEPLWPSANLLIVREDNKHYLCVKDYNGLDVKCPCRLTCINPWSPASGAVSGDCRACRRWALL